MTTINRGIPSTLEPESESSISGVIGAEKARREERIAQISAMATEGVDILNASVLDSPLSSADPGSVPRSPASPSGGLEYEQPGEGGAGGSEPSLLESALSYSSPMGALSGDTTQGVGANVVAGGIEGILNTWNNTIVPIVEWTANEYSDNAQIMQHGE
ncbi:MAG TPA: hypothetical protein EYN51_10780 [Flavobacteriales bacterium]|nr:hypothetical protein [Flavobacteriales bacterium]